MKGQCGKMIARPHRFKRYGRVFVCEQECGAVGVSWKVDRLLGCDRYWLHPIGTKLDVDYVYVKHSIWRTLFG